MEEGDTTIYFQTRLAGKFGLLPDNELTRRSEDETFFERRSEASKQ
jgi:hypothetical protein